MSVNETQFSRTYNRVTFNTYVLSLYYIINSLLISGSRLAKTMIPCAFWFHSIVQRNVEQCPKPQCPQESYEPAILWAITTIYDFGTYIVPWHPCSFQDRHRITDIIGHILEVQNPGIVVIWENILFEMPKIVWQEIALPWPGNKVRENWVGWQSESGWECVSHLIWQ